MKKILVLRGGALGDFIVTLPALALLRSRWPAAQIELVGNATAAALGLSSGVLNAVHSQHAARWSTLYRSAALPAGLGCELAAFDLVLNFWPDPDHVLAGHFPRHTGQIFLSAPALPCIAPAAAHYTAPLQAFGLNSASNWFRLGRPVSTASTVALHPGSGSSQKNWPLSRWIELCTWLREYQRGELLLITGEADTAAASALARFGPGAHQLPLTELVEKLAQCRCFIGHDSGISHLAAACGLPSLLLFGPTDPALWAPPAGHVRVLRRGPELAAITLSEVQHALAATLSDQV